MSQDKKSKGNCSAPTTCPVKTVRRDIGVAIVAAFGMGGFAWFVVAHMQKSKGWDLLDYGGLALLAIMLIWLAWGVAEVRQMLKRR